jgi:hypothetical protein
MSGEVGLLAGDRVVSHERSRPAELARPQDLRSRRAGPYPSHSCGWFSCYALLAHGDRCRNTVTARNVNSIDAFERGQSIAPETSSFSGSAMRRITRTFPSTKPLSREIARPSAILSQRIPSRCSGTQLVPAVTQIRGLARDPKSSPPHSRCQSRCGSAHRTVQSPRANHARRPNALLMRDTKSTFRSHLS